MCRNPGGHYNPSSLARWRNRLDAAGAEELLAQSIEAAKTLAAIPPRDLRVLSIDTTVQEKNVAHSTDSRLLEVARSKLAGKAAEGGINLRQSYARTGSQLNRQAGRYAHARQYTRMRRVINRQRSIGGRVHPEFGVKASFAVTEHKGLVVGAGSFPGNPYDKDTLAGHLEQTAILTDTPVKTALVDLGYRGREVDGMRILHRGKPKRMNKAEKRLLKRRQAVEPSTGHLKADHRLRRNFLKGAQGDSMNPILAAAGFNIRWLMR